MSLQVIPASPIQRLPFDVLWLIFEYISHGEFLKGPITLSHVSQLWRQIALSSPFIWSNITILLNDDASATASPQQHLLASAYLKRSQNVPITLTIHATRPLETREKNELLQPHAHRFCSLQIKASKESLAILLWMQIEMNMPMPRLEAFETVISDTSESRIGINRTITTIEETINIIPPVSASDGLICWDLWCPRRLTSLTLETACLSNKPDLEDIYAMLATTCNTLQKFHYLGLISSIDDSDAHWQVNRNHLEFPELHSLAVFCNDSMVPLLQFMIIPKLESLTLRDFVAYPATMPTQELMEEIDENTLTFDPLADDLFQVINRWTTISHLEIYGIEEPFNHLFPRPQLDRKSVV